MQDSFQDKSFSTLLSVGWAIFISISFSIKLSVLECHDRPLTKHLFQILHIRLSLLIAQSLPSIRKRLIKSENGHNSNGQRYMFDACVQELQILCSQIHRILQIIFYKSQFINLSNYSSEMQFINFDQIIVCFSCLQFIQVAIYLQLHMNREQQIENYEEVQEYLQKNNIYSIFSQLVQDLILEKPANVLDYFINKLSKPQKLTLFVVGPPGLSINSIIKKSLANNDRTFQLFNCGQEITSVQSKLSQQQKIRFKSCRLVDESHLGDTINKIQKIAKSQKNAIIEGFPKNLKQALILQKRGVYVKNVLIININNESLKEICEKKLKAFNPNVQEKELNKLITDAINEHNLYLREIKSFYNQYWEIDLSQNREEDYILSELNKAFTIKTIQPTPRTTTQIIIMGAPLSGRTTLGKKIAQYYSFVYISTSFLIAQQIRKDTIHGRKIKNQFLNNELIDNFLIEKLIEERISKKDCKIQGVVIEGYPKNKQQFDNIKNMRLHPSFIVAINTPKELSQSRSNLPAEKLNARYQNWQNLASHLRESKQKIFWVNNNLSIGNLFEQVVHEFQKQFI